MSEEKRVHLRKSLRTKSRISNKDKSVWNVIELLDISLGGAAFVCGDQLEVGGSYGLRFYLPGDPDIVEITIEISHCLSHPKFPGHRAGAKYTEMKTADFEKIEHYIATDNLAIYR
jgi:c-di-GMP-binding flagellar brake protein YcgR